MTPSQILSKNLKTIMDKAGVNSSRLSQLCYEAGYTENSTTLKTTLSRISTGDANIRMNNLETIYNSVKLLPGFERFALNDLLDENFTESKVTIDAEQMDAFIQELLSNLHELQWIKLLQEPSLISGVARLVAKTHGIDVIRKESAELASSVR